MQMRVPTHIGELTAEWLSGALGHPVSGYNAVSVADGYMSEVYRINLEPAGPLESLILKLPSLDVHRRELAAEFSSYEKESGCYALLAGSNLPIPHCYFNYIEGGFALGLEDLSDWPETDLHAGASQAQVMLAAGTLAGLHGRFWNTHDLPAFRIALTAAAAGMQTFVTDCIKDLPANDVTRLLAHYARSSLSFLPLFEAQPQVLSHMDFRLANIRFRDSALRVFDWGEYSLAPPGFDLAYFMTMSVTTDNRRAWEQEALECYLLRGNGIENYSAESLFDSYRLAMLPGYYMPALALTQGNRAEGEALQKRSLAAIGDHIEFLRGLAPGSQTR